MAPIIYGMDFSPPARSCFLTIRALGIEFEFKEVNLMDGDHLKPEFLKINPLHTIPTLQDGDFTIWDSHAINAYLVDKYGKDDSLYPKDLQKRAVVNQRMFFEVDVLWKKLGALVVGAKSIDKAKAAELIAAYNSLETLLEKSTYVAGEQLTIADFSIVTTLTGTNAVIPLASNRFPKINEWLSKMQALPYYHFANQVGLDKYSAFIRSMLGLD